MTTLSRLPTLALAGALSASIALAQGDPGDPGDGGDGTDFGDAPEDAIAYPSIGVMGAFPACLGGSAGYVRHGLGWAHFYRPGWTGAGDFEDGESEDYLVRVDLRGVPTRGSTWGSIKSHYR
jgi:hypothetical protein